MNGNNDDIADVCQVCPIKLSDTKDEYKKDNNNNAQDSGNSGDSGDSEDIGENKYSGVRVECSEQTLISSTDTNYSITEIKDMIQQTFAELDVWERLNQSQFSDGLYSFLVPRLNKDVLPNKQIFDSIINQFIIQRFIIPNRLQHWLEAPTRNVNQAKQFVSLLRVLWNSDLIFAGNIVRDYFALCHLSDKDPFHESSVHYFDIDLNSIKIQFIVCARKFSLNPKHNFDEWKVEEVMSLLTNQTNQDEPLTPKTYIASRKKNIPDPKMSNDRATKATELHSTDVSLLVRNDQTLTATKQIFNTFKDTIKGLDEDEDKNEDQYQKEDKEDNNFVFLLEVFEYNDWTENEKKIMSMSIC